MKNHSKAIEALSQPQHEMIEKGMNVIAGLDLGDQYSHVCLLDLEGNITRARGTTVSSSYFGAWASMRVVFEAGTHGSTGSGTGHEALMADTHRLALESLSKGDRATLGDCDAPMLNAAVFARDATGSHPAAGTRGRGRRAPLDANVLTMTVMATKMPLVGRG